MTVRRRGAVGLRTLLVAPLAAVVLGACGDGAPAFCGPLGETADLEALSHALLQDDLSAARAEAERLHDLTASAPTELRADVAALADAVVDIVDLLEDEQEASEPDEDRPGVGAAQVERRREDLNARFGELDRRATRVTTWAARECGLELD